MSKVKTKKGMVSTPLSASILETVNDAFISEMVVLTEKDDAFISEMVVLAEKEYISTMRFQYGAEYINNIKGDSEEKEKLIKRFIVTLSSMGTANEVREAISNIIETTELDKFQVVFDTTMPYYRGTCEGIKVDVYLNLHWNTEKEVLSELAGCELIKTEFQYSSGGYTCKLNNKKEG